MVVWLDEASGENRRDIGYKAANLGRLLDQGLNVPQGFVIPRETLEQILDRSNAKHRIRRERGGIDFNDQSSIRQASENIRNIIQSIDIPESIADEIQEAYKEINLSEKVRNAGDKAVDLIGGQRKTESVVVRASPSSESEAGLYNSRIGVAGPDAILEAVKEVWASYYSPEALYFRHQQESNSSIGIILQRVVEADVSGYLFTETETKATGDSNIVVESVYGLAQPLRDGEITPDRYVIDRHTGRVQDTAVAEKRLQLAKNPSTGKIVEQETSAKQRNEQSLDAEQLSDLLETATTAESTVGRPLRLGFAVSRGQIYLTAANRAGRVFLPDKNGQELQGVPSSPTKIRGEVTIAYTQPAQNSGELLLTPDASKELITVQGKSRAVLADNGGVSSSLSILAHQLGLPVAVGFSKATDLLATGQAVTLNEDGTLTEEQEEDVEETVETSIPGSFTEVPAAHILTIGQQLEQADGHVNPARERMPPRIEWQGRQDAIVRDLNGELQDSFYLVEDYASILHVKEAVEKNAKGILLNVDALQKENSGPSLRRALETVAEASESVESGIITRNQDTAVLDAAVEAGIDLFIVPADRFNAFQRELTRVEKRFILSRLREFQNDEDFPA